VPDSSDPSEGMPRWVKVFALLAVVFVLLFGLLHATGRGLGGHSLHGVPEHGAQP
jgi:hypothetical protein